MGWMLISGVRAGRSERADGQSGGFDEAAQRYHRFSFLTHTDPSERASRRSQHLQTLRLSGVDVFCQSSPETEPHGEQRHQLPSRQSVGNPLSSDVRLNLLVVSSHRCAWFRRLQNGSFIKPHPLTSDERFHVFGGDGLNASSSCQFLAAKTRHQLDYTFTPGWGHSSSLQLQIFFILLLWNSKHKQMYNLYFDICDVTLLNTCRWKNQSVVQSFWW